MTPENHIAGSANGRNGKSTVLDALKRPLHDIRISVIDNCNMRCTYCMPVEEYGENYTFLRQHELMSYDEILRLVRLVTQIGVSKVRITGGEPLLRKGLPDLMAGLVNVPGLDDIALTTNGLLLPRQAQALHDAGLDRITVSLDSLDDAIFGKMNGRNIPVAGVLEGIGAAREAGFKTIKINAVIQRGVNDHEILDMARYFKENNCTLRFIEYMDVGTRNGWHSGDVVSSREILERIHDEFPLRAVKPGYRGEVASRYAYEDGSGEIGFISSVTDTFCGDCSRARVSASGTLYTCLFASQGTNLMPILRGEMTDDEITNWLAGIWSKRDDRYSELRESATNADQPVEKVEMFRMGG